MPSLPTAILLAAALAFTSAACAQERSHPKLQDRFYLNLGGYWPSVDTSLNVNGPLGRNPEFSLERDLGYDDKGSMPFALANLRLGGRWHIEGEAFQLRRSKVHVLDRDITVRDTSFPVNANVSSDFNIDVYRLGLGFSILNRPSTEAGIMVGVHITQFELDMQTGGGAVAARTDATAPLPMIGLYAYHAFTPKWLGVARSDVFSFNYDQYSGHLLNLNIGAEYQLAKHLNIGATYRYVQLKLDAYGNGPITGNEWAGHFENRFSGPTLYLSLGF